MFDLVVIGTGSGLDVAAEAVERGMRVAIVEQGPFGGTCLNRGCIPSKMLIACADVMQTVRRAHRFGIRVRVEGIDWGHIVRRAFEEVDQEARTLEEVNRGLPNVDVFKGTARFVGVKALEVAGQRVEGERVVIAAGTRPAVPRIPGLSEVPYLTSDEALRLPRQPRSMLILGGGYIMAEMAHFFGALGTEVTIIYRGPRLLRREDEEVSARFTEVYGRRFRLLLNTQVKRAFRGGDGVALEVETPEGEATLEAEALLLATGRVPNSDILQVERTGVEVDGRGFVRTNEYMETSVPGIWALGDIVGRYLLKHNANLEAAHVAYNILHPRHKIPVDYHAMPHAVFSWPQVAGVGLTEAQLREQGREYTSAIYRYRDTAYGSAIEDDEGFVKVLAGPEGEVLGCHILGSHASILVQEAVNLMRSRLTTAHITQSIYIHPALTEVVQRAFLSLGL